MTWVIACQVDPSANGGVCPDNKTVWVDLPDQPVYSPFNLDVAGAVQIGVAILSVWAVGWAFAMLARVINETDGG
jgi:hypothetical protein